MFGGTNLLYEGKMRGRLGGSTRGLKRSADLTRLYPALPLTAPVCSKLRTLGGSQVTTYEERCPIEQKDLALWMVPRSAAIMSRSARDGQGR